MTTNASPDGQTNSNGQAATQGGSNGGSAIAGGGAAGGGAASGAGGGAAGGQSADAGENSGEPIRNMEDVRKIIAQRDQLKERVRQLESGGQSGGGIVGNQQHQQQQQVQQQGQQAQQGGSADADINRIVDAKLAERDKERGRLDRRKAITDVILESAHPQHKEALRLMLPSLHEAKEFDMDAEDTKSESEKALDKLRKRFPGYFRPTGAGGGGTQRGADASLEGVEWMQLSPEEQRSMSDEQFRQLRQNGRRRGSNLAGRTPNRT